MAAFAVCSFSWAECTLGVERYYFRQHSQSLNTDDGVIAIHNLLLGNCRIAVCFAAKAKNSQYKMSIRPM